MLEAMSPLVNQLLGLLAVLSSGHGHRHRREHDRAQRHARIVTAARTLAEAEGWDAVTTRRLADSIEYSQPVLYSHFENRDAIVAAVAVEGFAELAASLQHATTDTPSPNNALESIPAPTFAFAISKPALYNAMFTLATLPFGQPERPAAIATASPPSGKPSRRCRRPRCRHPHPAHMEPLPASPSLPAPGASPTEPTRHDSRCSPRSSSVPHLTAAPPTANQEGMNRIDLPASTGGRKTSRKTSGPIS